MTTIDITDIASTRTVNPLAVRDDYMVSIKKVEKFANEYALVELFKLYSSSRGTEKEMLYNFTVLLKDVDACKMKVKHIVTTLLERLNYPEALSMEVSNEVLDSVHFSFKDVLEARNFIHKCIVAEVLPKEEKISPDIIVDISGFDKIVVPSRGVSNAAVKEEIEKSLEKFIGRPATKETRMLIESVVKSIVNKHALYGGRR